MGADPAFVAPLRSAIEPVPVSTKGFNRGEGSAAQPPTPDAIDRALLQQIYIRVCRDSGFTLDMHRAAALAAKVVGKHPLNIWMALPSLDVMAAIATGEHPAARA